MRAVLFDLDDTLLDHTSAAAAALSSWFDDQGMADDELRERWATATDLHYGRFARGEISYVAQRRERVRSVWGPDLTDEAADALFTGYLGHYEASWAAFPDALPALRRAHRAGIAVGVLTNGDEGQQSRKLAGVGLAPEIDVLITSSMLAFGKPHASAFLHAAQRLGVDPEDTLMVGDSLEADVQGAVDAGLTAVLLDREDRHPEVSLSRIRSLDELDFRAAERA